MDTKHGRYFLILVLKIGEHKSANVNRAERGKSTAAAPYTHRWRLTTSRLSNECFVHADRLDGEVRDMEDCGFRF